eukprot:g275.t1
MKVSFLLTTYSTAEEVRQHPARRGILMDLFAPPASEQLPRVSFRFFRQLLAKAKQYDDRVFYFKKNGRTSTGRHHQHHDAQLQGSRAVDPGDDGGAALTSCESVFQLLETIHQYRLHLRASDTAFVSAGPMQPVVHSSDGQSQKARTLNRSFHRFMMPNVDLDHLATSHGGLDRNLVVSVPERRLLDLLPLFLFGERPSQRASEELLRDVALDEKQESAASQMFSAQERRLILEALSPFAFVDEDESSVVSPVTESSSPSAAAGQALFSSFSEARPRSRSPADHSSLCAAFLRVVVVHGYAHPLRFVDKPKKQSAAEVWRTHPATENMKDLHRLRGSKKKASRARLREKEDGGVASKAAVGHEDARTGSHDAYYDERLSMVERKMKMGLIDKVEVQIPGNREPQFGYHFLPENDLARAKACSTVKEEVLLRSSRGRGVDSEELLELDPDHLKLRDWKREHFMCWMACRQAVAHELRDGEVDWGDRGNMSTPPAGAPRAATAVRPTSTISGSHLYQEDGEKHHGPGEENFRAAYEDPVDVLAVISKAVNVVKGWEGLTIPQISTIGLAAQVDEEETESGLLYQILTGEGKTVTVAGISLFLMSTLRKVDYATSSMPLAQQNLEEVRDLLHFNFNRHETQADHNKNHGIVADGAIQPGKFFKGVALIVDECDSAMIDELATISKLSTELPGVEELGEFVEYLPKWGSEEYTDIETQKKTVYEEELWAKEHQGSSTPIEHPYDGRVWVYVPDDDGDEHRLALGTGTAGRVQERRTKTKKFWYNLEADFELLSAHLDQQHQQEQEEEELYPVQGADGVPSSSKMSTYPYEVLFNSHSVSEKRGPAHAQGEADKALADGAKNDFPPRFFPGPAIRFSGLRGATETDGGKMKLKASSSSGTARSAAQLDNEKQYSSVDEAAKEWKKQKEVRAKMREVELQQNSQQEGQQGAGQAAVGLKPEQISGIIVDPETLLELCLVEHVAAKVEDSLRFPGDPSSGGRASSWSFLAVPSHLEQFARLQLRPWVRSAMTALFHFQVDKHYTIENGLIKPVDFAATGVVQGSTVWSDGLHQFLQIKHGLALKPEGWTTNFLSNMGYMRRYQKQNIFGLTGTLGELNTERKLLKQIYGTDTVEVAPTYDRQLLEYPAIAVEDRSTQLLSQLDEVEAQHQEGEVLQTMLSRNIVHGFNGYALWLKTIVRATMVEVARRRAVLVICPDIATADLVFDLLNALGAADRSDIRSVKKYTSSGDEEATLAIKKLYPKDVVVATNLAGRGTHIDSKAVARFGGLHVIQTALPLSSRVEMQAAGRTARQGEKGSWQLILFEGTTTEGHQMNEKSGTIDSEHEQADADALKQLQEDVLEDVLDNTAARLRRERDAREQARIEQFQEKEASKIRVRDQLFSEFEAGLDNITATLGSPVDLLAHEVKTFTKKVSLYDADDREARAKAKPARIRMMKREAAEEQELEWVRGNIRKKFLKELDQRSPSRYLSGANETHKRAARQGAEYYWAMWLKKLGADGDRGLNELVQSAKASAQSQSTAEEQLQEQGSGGQISASVFSRRAPPPLAKEEANIVSLEYENRVGRVVQRLLDEKYGTTGVKIKKPKISKDRLIAGVKEWLREEEPQNRNNDHDEITSYLKVLGDLWEEAKEVDYSHVGGAPKLSNEWEIVVPGYGLLAANPLYQLRVAKQMQLQRLRLTAENEKSVASLDEGGGGHGQELLAGDFRSKDELDSFLMSVKATFLLDAFAKKTLEKDAGMGGGVISAAGLYQSFLRRLSSLSSVNHVRGKGNRSSIFNISGRDKGNRDDQDSQVVVSHSHSQEKNKLLVLQDLTLAMHKVQEDAHWSLAFQDLTWLRGGALGSVHDQIDLVLDEVAHLLAHATGAHAVGAGRARRRASFFPPLATKSATEFGGLPFLRSLAEKDVNKELIDRVGGFSIELALSGDTLAQVAVWICSSNGKGTKGKDNDGESRRIPLLQVPREKARPHEKAQPKQAFTRFHVTTEEREQDLQHDVVLGRKNGSETDEDKNYSDVFMGRRISAGKERNIQCENLNRFRGGQHDERSNSNSRLRPGSLGAILISLASCSAVDGPAPPGTGRGAGEVLGQDALLLAGEWESQSSIAELAASAGRAVIALDKEIEELTDEQIERALEAADRPPEREYERREAKADLRRRLADVKDAVDLIDFAETAQRDALWSQMMRAKWSAEKTRLEDMIDVRGRVLQAQVSAASGKKALVPTQLRKEIRKEIEDIRNWLQAQSDKSEAGGMLAYDRKTDVTTWPVKRRRLLEEEAKKRERQDEQQEEQAHSWSDEENKKKETKTGSPLPWLSRFLFDTLHPAAVEAEADLSLQTPFTLTMNAMEHDFLQGHADKRDAPDEQPLGWRIFNQLLPEHLARDEDLQVMLSVGGFRTVSEAKAARKWIRERQGGGGHFSATSHWTKIKNRSEAKFSDHKNHLPLCPNEPEIGLRIQYLTQEQAEKLLDRVNKVLEGEDIAARVILGLCS